MAFQAGSTIRPELANADYSGFANAATIQANSLAQLGATIGSAIQVAGEKKKEKALSKQAKEMVYGMLKQNPKQAAFFGLPEDFELNDVTPFVDVMRPGPTIAMVMQLNMASMKAGQTKRPTIGDITKLREFLPSDKVIEDGRIVDTTLRNEILPENHPLVQQILNSDMSSQLYGYEPPEPLELNKEDEATVVDEPVEPSPKPVTQEPEFMRFGTFDARF
jgi:hypothetical protein